MNDEYVNAFMQGPVRHINRIRRLLGWPEVETKKRECVLRVLPCHKITREQWARAEKLWDRIAED